MSAKDRILVVGGSGHARVVIDIIERSGHWAIAGLLSEDHAKGEVILGYRVLGRTSEIEGIVEREGVAAGVVAIGDNWKRARVAGEIEARVRDFRFVSAVHPSAVIGLDVKMGRGSVAMSRTVVNAATVVGDFAIINTQAYVGHDSVLRDFVSIGPNATIGGYVEVGAYGVVALGASVIQGVRIGEHSVVGAGAVAVRNIPEYVVAYGVPAKVVRRRSAGEPYL